MTSTSLQDSDEGPQRSVQDSDEEPLKLRSQCGKPSGEGPPKSRSRGTHKSSTKYDEGKLNSFSLIDCCRSDQFTIRGGAPQPVVGVWFGCHGKETLTKLTRSHSGSNAETAASCPLSFLIYSTVSKDNTMSCYSFPLIFTLLDLIQPTSTSYRFSP